MERKLRQLSEKASESSGYFVWICFHWAREIPSMSDGVVRRLLHKGPQE